MTATPHLAIENVRKLYQTVAALDDVSLSSRPMTMLFCWVRRGAARYLAVGYRGVCSTHLRPGQDRRA